MLKPGFWGDQGAAGKVVAAQKRARAIVGPMRHADSTMEDLEVLLELAEEDEAAVTADIEEALSALEEGLDKAEFQLMLGGEHDHRNAILNLQAGAGGVDACDWAEMLLRMYLRWAERMDFDFEEIDLQRAEEAGIRSASVLIKGSYAYGWLKAEQGVHRLVRISPFDAQNRRQTSFASAEVVPEFDDDIEIEIPEKELRVDTFRASGAGGQHVNKTESAVRFTHLPTGIVVSCQNERSQHKNRATAMKVLRAKLYQLELAKREDALKGFYGDRGSIAWGNQIRSYVLQPYQMVKDLRTTHQNGNAQAVLDGNLTPFMEAWLKMRRGDK
ncbi:MAG: peptide chain release factor 2 [Planctomycetes bacterium]|nr:peptide chain release factor 2 [Planctomycetota bacterium]